MKIRNIFIAIYFLIGLCETYSQTFKGVYFSSYSQEIIIKGKAHYPDGKNERRRKKKIIDPAEFHTVFSEEYIILDFVSKHNLVIKYLGGLEELGSYRIKNDKIKINSKNYKFNGIILGNKTIKLINKTSKGNTLETFFNPISESNLDYSSIPDTSYFYNSKWVIHADSCFMYHGMDLYFPDSNIVVLRNQRNEKFDIGFGEAVSSSYKNHFFLGIHDSRNLNFYHYHFTEQNDSVLFADSYVVSNFEDPPLFKKMQFQKKKLPSKTSFQNRINQLIGTWHSENKSIERYEYSKFDSIMKHNLQIQFFKDKTFLMQESCILLQENIEFPYNKATEGNWELSKTTNYIVLNGLNDRTRFLNLNTKNKEDFLISIWVEAFGAASDQIDLEKKEN